MLPSPVRTETSGKGDNKCPAGQRTSSLASLNTMNSVRGVCFMCVFRVYNIETGKLKKCLKGSSSDEGALLKVQTHLLTIVVKNCSYFKITFLMNSWKSFLDTFFKSLFQNSFVQFCLVTFGKPLVTCPLKVFIVEQSYKVLSFCFTFSKQLKWVQRTCHSKTFPAAQFWAVMFELSHEYRFSLS